MEKLTEIRVRIEQTPTVAEAIRFHLAAQERTIGLRAAQTALSRRTREISQKLADSSSALEGDVIKALTRGADLKHLGTHFDSIARIEMEHRYLTRANSRVVEQLLPLAEIGELEASATSLEERGRALRDLAEQRVRKTAELMSQAAEYEGEIVFDISHTLSGELQAHATELEKRALGYRNLARERADRHATLSRQIESVNALRTL